MVHRVFSLWMMLAHIHSTKEKLYGLFNLHVQLNITIGENKKSYAENKKCKSPQILKYQGKTKKCEVMQQWVKYFSSATAVFNGCRESLDYIEFLEDKPIIYTLFIPLEDRIGIGGTGKAWDESCAFFLGLHFFLGDGFFARGIDRNLIRVKKWSSFL